jgi:thiamine biosynthesis protein ThiS
MIKVFVNGEAHDVPPGNLLDLLEHFKLKKQWTIAEVNEEAIARDDYNNTQLQSGDIIELVRAVAGG